MTKQKNLNSPVARRAPAKRTTANTAAILKALTLEATAVGLDGIAASSIAKRAGLTTGAIYNRFENNDEMLVALWEQVVAQKFGDHVRQTIHYLNAQEKISLDPDLIARLERPSATLALAAEFVVVAQRNEVVGEVVIPQITQWLYDAGLNKNSSPIECAGVALGASMVLGSILRSFITTTNPNLGLVLRGLRQAYLTAQPTTTAPPVPEPRPVEANTGNAVRDALINATAEVMAKTGFTSATISRIARKSKLTSGTIYNVYEPQIDLSGFDNKIHSYVSSDNGKTWVLESGIKIDAGSPVSVQAASTGGYEAWGWVLSPNADKMTKFTSSDGETFTAGSGLIPVLNSCKNVNGVSTTKFGDFQVVKLLNGTFLAFAQNSNETPPYMRHACGFTSPDGVTWTLDAAKTVALQYDIQTNPETYRNASGVIEQIFPVFRLDPSTNLATGLQFRTSTNEGVSWSDFSELSFFAADPDRLDLSNGDSLLAFGGFDHGQGGLLAVAKKSATNYKASRTENFFEWITWTISGASQSDIKIKNLCTNKDLTSSVKFSTSGSNISAAYTAPAGGKGNSCVYALIGPEQALK